MKKSKVIIRRKMKKSKEIMLFYVFLQYFFYYLGEVFHFELVLFLGDVIDGVVGGEGYFVLGDDLAGIANGGDPVDGHACFCLACFFHGLMHMVTPHALAAILGQ